MSFQNLASGISVLSKIQQHKRVKAQICLREEGFFTDIFRVNIVNLESSDLIATNHLVYRLCRLTFNKLGCHCNREPNQSEHCHNKEAATAVIYDCAANFDLIHFSTLFLSDTALKHYRIVKVGDRFLQLSLRTYLQNELALNPFLQLVVIYADQFLGEILQTITSFKENIAFLVIVPHFTHGLFTNYISNKPCQLLHCKTSHVGEVTVTKMLKDGRVGKVLVGKVTKLYGLIWKD